MEKNRGKACWKYTHVETGKVYYTRNRAILEDHIKYNSRVLKLFYTVIGVYSGF